MPLFAWLKTNGGITMGATSFQRMRRIHALREQCVELGIEGFEEMDETQLREAVAVATPAEETNEPQELTSDDPEPDAPDPADEKAELQAKAKALGIKKWHLKSVETLEKEIAEIEGA